MLINEKRKEIFKLKRRIYMNQGINVQMYSIEPGYPNSSNCLVGCSPGGGGPGGPIPATAGMIVVVGGVIVGTIVDPIE